MKKLRIAAMGDLHVKEDSNGEYAEIFKQVSEKADVLVLCGDLTDFGLPSEAKLLWEQLGLLKIPVLGVLGNHDYQSNHHEQIKKILTEDKRMIHLEDSPVEINGVGFVGAKGFAGGFDSHMLGAFGESEIKHFVQESVNQELKLENALNGVRVDRKVVVMHYSPVKETVVGEPEEIYPFLGSSRLEEPIDHFNVTAVFHGHSHYGSLKGKTNKGVPVYNVALPLLMRNNPEEPFVIVEV